MKIRWSGIKKAKAGLDTEPWETQKTQTQGDRNPAPRLLPDYFYL